MSDLLNAARKKSNSGPLLDAARARLNAASEAGPSTGQKVGGALIDTAKGMAEGVAGIADLPSVLPQLAIRGGATVGEWTGLVEPGTSARLGQTFGEMNRNLPSQKAGRAVDAVSGAVVGDYPETTLGEFGRTGAQFVTGGGALGGRPVSMAAAGLASETAGQLTEGTRAEPWARLAAAIFGGMAPDAAKLAVQKIVSPNAGVPAARREFAAQMADEGVPLTAGQRTGNTALQYSDDVSAGGVTMRIEQMEAFTRAAMRRVGVNGLATPENMRGATKAIGATFDDVAKNATVQVNATLIGTTRAALSDYMETVGTQAALPKNIASVVFRGGVSGQITGKQYLDITSRLGKQLKSSDSSMREFAHTMRSALDDALEASVGAKDAARLAVARRQYRDLLAIEKAVSRAGEGTAYGTISPEALAGATKGQGTRAYVQGQRDIGDLARAGVGTMKALPQSGTQPRLSAAIARSLGPVAGGAGAGGAAALGAGLGPAGVAAASAAGALLPRIYNAAAQSRYGQNYLANQIMAPARTGFGRNLLATFGAGAGKLRDN